MSLFVAEPPAAYRVNRPAVVDSSVLASFIYLEPKAAEAEVALRPYVLHAPSILPLEVANVATYKLRRGIADPDALGERLAAFDFACINLREVAPRDAFALAARYQLTAYDAAYLWLAGELRAPLLTFDSRLAEAGRHYLAQLPPP